MEIVGNMTDSDMVLVYFVGIMAALCLVLGFGINYISTHTGDDPAQRRRAKDQTRRHCCHRCCHNHTNNQR